MPNTLKEQVLLEDLDERELERIGGVMQRLRFSKGEDIFGENEETRGLYLIQSGTVTISKVTPDGWRQTIAVFSTGHFFGELSILEKRRHEAFATASENTEIILLSKEDFERLEREDMALAFKITKRIALVMCRNLRRMNDKFLNALISY